MMESKKDKRTMVWGVLLIVFGLAALAQIFAGLSEWFIVGVFALGGLASLSVYLTNRTDWQLLIPTYILFANAIIIALAEVNILAGEVIAVLVLTLIALPFLATFLFNRNNWWALIPTYALLAIALMILLIGLEILQDGFIAFYVLASVGVPFLVVFLRDQKHWWALIPAYTMFSIGIMIALIDLRVLNDFSIPAYVMLSIAAPFFVVFLLNRKQKWALIPGGIMALIGLGFFAGSDLAKYVLPAAFILVGGWVLFRSFRGSEDKEEITDEVEV